MKVTKRSMLAVLQALALAPRSRGAGSSNTLLPGREATPPEHPVGDPEIPRVLGANKCSGSTWIQQTARELLRLHGMNVAHAGFELKGVLKGKAGRTPGAKIKTVMSDVSRSNQTLVLKVGPHNNNAGVRDVLGRNGARLLVITSDDTAQRPRPSRVQR